MNVNAIVRAPAVLGSANLAAGAASAQSATFATIGGDTTLTGDVLVMLTADALCYVKVGANPTAAAGSIMLGTTPITLRVPGGAKLAAIQKAAAAIVNIVVLRQ